MGSSSGFTRLQHHILQAENVAGTESATKSWLQLDGAILSSSLQTPLSAQYVGGLLNGRRGTHSTADGTSDARRHMFANAVELSKIKLNSMQQWQLPTGFNLGACLSQDPTMATLLSHSDAAVALCNQMQQSLLLCQQQQQQQQQASTAAMQPPNMQASNTHPATNPPSSTMPVQHPFAQLPPLPRSDSSSLSQSPNQGQGLGQGQVQVQGHEQPQGQGQTRAGSQGRSNFRVPFAAPSVPAVPPQPPPVYPQQQLPQQQPAKATSSSAQWGASGLVGTKRVAREHDGGGAGEGRAAKACPSPEPSVLSSTFTSAHDALVKEQVRKGQLPPSALQQSQQGFGAGGRGSSARGGAGNGGGGRAGGGGRMVGNSRPFQPPGLMKAIGDQQGGGGGGIAGGGGGAPENERYPPRLMEMLEKKGLIGPDGSVPEELCKLDDALVAEAIKDVLPEGNNISWDDIAGQAEAKRLIQEMVVWPVLNPGLFSGVRTPPKGLLLFGPPGTGKTLLGKAVAGNINATFFSISSSSLMSKWIGQGERAVKTLFVLAGLLQPSVIFIDEIDSLLSARKAEGEHESSRRMKTELLVQMEGCDPASAKRRVLLIGATNRPEELDEAARRRMPKQLYIPLPCAAAREVLLQRYLRKESHSLTDDEVKRVVANTEGYSGSDMHQFITEALRIPIQEAVRAKGAAWVAGARLEDLRPASFRDFRESSRRQRKSVSAEEIERYIKYNELYGTRYHDENDLNEDDIDEAWK